MPGIGVRDRDGKPLAQCEKTGPSTPISDFDVTFLCVLPRFNTFVHDEVAADAVDTSARFVLFGSAESLAKELKDLRVVELDQPAPGSGATLRFAGPAGSPGDSGAILGNCRGIVGMFLDSEQQLLSLETIRAQAKEVQVPWTLNRAEYFASGATSTVCPTFESGTSHGLLLRPLAGGAEVELKGCASVQHANYEVAVREPWLDCRPRNLLLSSRSEARVDFRASCTVRLTGNWRSDDAGELGCVETSPGFAECSGWLGLKVGMFSGTAKAVGDSQVSFRGQFAGLMNSDAATGEFTWSNDALKGTLRFGGWEREFSLQRSP
jgi:hypothetical protein